MDHLGGPNVIAKGPCKGNSEAEELEVEEMTEAENREERNLMTLHCWLC